MLWAMIAVLGGLVLLVWSADRFVAGATITARYFRLPPLLIGMVIVGFGTSAPEMTVSALAAMGDNPGIALGNAYGSNITNIALILGLTALLRPITVGSGVLRKELPLLTAVTALSALLLWDGELSRMDAWLLLGAFTLLVGWTLLEGVRARNDNLGQEMERELEGLQTSLGKGVFWLALGLSLLVLSSRLLVWGAVEVARRMGLGDLTIGLTIIAVGTSLPELASSVMASRKGEHDLALGNVLGSNLFNTLAVVGVAGVIRPLTAPPHMFERDFAAMGLLTVSLFLLGFGWRGPGKINRIEGAVLLTAYLGYMFLLLRGPG